MRYFLLVTTAMLVGCGQPAVTREEAEKEEAEMRALLNSLEADKEEAEAKPKAEPKSEVKKPLTKEESAKVIEKTLQ